MKWTPREKRAFKRRWLFLWDFLHFEWQDDAKQREVERRKEEALDAALQFHLLDES